MKKQLFITVLVLVLCFSKNMYSQNTSITIKKCYLPSDTSKTLNLPLNQIQVWADSLPLTVYCDNGEKFTLHQYNFSIIYKNPMQIKDLGLANDGIPILARKAIDKLKMGDTILLKDVTAYDSAGKETKLPAIVFSIKE